MSNAVPFVERVRRRIFQVLYWLKVLPQSVMAGLRFTGTDDDVYCTTDSPYLFGVQIRFDRVALLPHPKIAFSRAREGLGVVFPDVVNGTLDIDSPWVSE